MTAARKLVDAAQPITFTYFAPRSPLPRWRGDLKAYAAEHAKQMTPTQVVTVPSLKALRKWIADHAVVGRKGDAGYIVAGECTDSRDNVTGPAAFALPDYDGADIDWVEAEQYEGFAWTTASHTAEQPAWRLVVPFASPVTHGKLESPLAGAHIRVQHQPAFLPTYEVGAEVEWRVLAGTQRLDATELAPNRERRRAAKSRAPRAPRPAQDGAFPFDAPPDLSAVEKICPPAGTPANDMRHPLVRGLGGWLARRGYAPEAIAEAVRAHVPSSDPAARMAQALEAAEAVRAGVEGVAGWNEICSFVEQFSDDAPRTLRQLEQACRDPREPQGFDGVWSEWWARVWPQWVARLAERRAANDTSNAAESPLILQSKSTYWLRKSDGTYGSQFVQAELVSRVAYELRDQYVSEDDCTPAKLQSKYTRAVERVIYSYTATATTYDAETNVVRAAALSRMPAERATFHEPIDRWLRLLFGASYEHGAQWIASCSDLSRPAPCLYLIGDAEIGKSLLFDGLARLWKCSSPVPMAEAIDDFNEKQIECPLVFTDEGLPPNYNSGRFRSAVTERERTVNRKNLAKVGVEGCVRLAIGANNSGVLRWAQHGEMSQADQGALVRRLTVIECPDSKAAGDFLRAVPTEQQNAWADHQIAEHALWLTQTVPLEPTGRMCALPHGGEPLVRAIANERYAPVARLILDALAAPLGARKAHVWRSAKDDRLVYVHTQAFHAWIRECGDTRLREGDLAEACRALAAPQGHVVSRQRLPKSAGGDRVYAYALEIGHIAAAAGVEIK